MRRGVSGKPDPIEYKEKKEKLSELKQLEDEEKIDLYYLDESGFCGIPCVPYGWQDIICDKLRKSANCQGGRQKNVK